MLRARRRGVARAVVGTAVVVGTAGAVRHHQDQKYAQQEATQQAAYDQQYAPPPEQYAPPPQQYAPEPAPAAPEVSPMTAQLQQLAQLHTSGVLTDEEFAAAKQKVLAGG